MKSRTISKSEKGFTLLEVLVALVIVSLTVTIFFQLLSSSTRLEYKSRQVMDFTVQATRTFRELMFFDVRQPDFPWEGQREGYSWRLKLIALEGVQEDTDPTEVNIKMPTELYRYEFVFTETESGRSMTLTLDQQYKKNFFSADFKAGLEQAGEDS